MGARGGGSERDTHTEKGRGRKKEQGELTGIVTVTALLLKVLYVRR